jgi:Fe-S cluster assembly iron-binding protein IscA
VIIYGTSEVERFVDEGEFVCPGCRTAANYSIVQVHEYFHLYFVPLFHRRMAAEHVHCRSCQHRYPLTVLAATAPAVTSPHELFRDRLEPTLTAVGNVVALTAAAVEELKRRHQAGKFSSDAVVRIGAPRQLGESFAVAFDYLEADGQDWIGQSHGIPIVVAKEDAPELAGKTIDFREGRFCSEV